MKKTVVVIVMLVVILASASVRVWARDDAEIQSSSESSTPNLTAVTVKSYPDKTIYDAFETLDKTGLELVAGFDDGTSRVLSPEEIEVSYRKDTCFRVGDSYVYLSFGGVVISVPVTVNRVEYDLSSLQLSDFSVIYDGGFNTLDRVLPDILGKDGIPLKIKVHGGGENVGKYDISIDFESESVDYYTPHTKVVTMTVEPYSAEVIWENLSFVYDGKSKVPSAYFIDVYGNRIYPSPIGSASNAGKNYIASVVFRDPNYILTNTEIGYEIKKADYNFEGVKWSLDSFVYDGSGKSISVSGLPEGVKVVSYVNDKATNAGKYTVTAKLSWEEENYNAPSALTHTWEISPAEYDLSGFSFLPMEYIYDGEMHYPELRGVMPVGADGIRLEYSFSAGACHVSDGTVSSVIIFSTKSKNYVVPSPMYSSVSVKPLEVEAVWRGNRLYYSGQPQAPSAVCSECLLTVKGGETVVGKYIAEAYSENTDYVVKNPYFEYEILKADNGFLSIPTDIVCYENRELSLPVSAKFGEVQFIYFSDSSGKSVISAPSASGTYYAKAMVSNTENYSGIESEIFSFKIEKIVAVSFFAELVREGLRAYEVLLPTDILCTVVNNDGSRETVDSSLVAVVYQSGDSLRKKDKYLTVKYEKFNFKIEITVDYADYDLSGTSWSMVDVEYDGEAKAPILSGLPVGVSVREYVGGGVINAGKYKVSAILDYDKENYNQPKVDACTFIIRKKVLEAPVVSAAYNGEYQTAISDSTLYYVANVIAKKDAGKYNVLMALYDTENYEFVGGESTCNGLFVITPRVICVEIDNVVLHLFEKIGEVAYTVTSGECVSGDTLTFLEYVSGKRVYLRSDNPNYTVISTGGTVKRLPYPTFLGGINIIVVLIFAFLLGLAVYFLLLRRHRLRNAIAVIKCRWRNRNISVYPPRRKNRKQRLSESWDADSEVNGLSNEKNGAASDTDENQSEASAREDFGTEKESEEIKEYSAGIGIDVAHADALISNSLAKNLINKEGKIIYTDGKAKNVINVDTLSENFTPGDKVDVNSLKNKSLVPYDTAYIKVLARGIIDKPLSVYANDFSLSAVKMIALTGGEAIKSVTAKKKDAPKNPDVQS